MPTNKHAQIRYQVLDRCFISFMKDSKGYNAPIESNLELQLEIIEKGKREYIEKEIIRLGGNVLI